MGDPAVSVVMPVYNGEDYVRSAVESVLRQTFQDFELIVVDDGSRDSTPEVVKSYGGRVRYVRQENAGAAAAFNHGISLARGRYISWLSHDDEFLPGKLEEQVRAAGRAGGPAVCYTDIQFIDARGEVTEERDLPEHPPGELLRNLLVAGPVTLAAYSLLYDRRCVEEVGVYDLSQRLTEDADMLLRLGGRFPFVRVPRRLMRIRRHGGRASLNPRWVPEARRFYREWLSRLGLEELFPELAGSRAGSERARARQWMGDRYAEHGTPPYLGLAMGQYLEALRESPAALPSLAPSLARLARRRLGNSRQFYRLGLRSAIARRLPGRKRT